MTDLTSLSQLFVKRCPVRAGLLAISSLLPAIVAAAGPVAASPREVTLADCVALAAERSPALEAERSRLAQAQADDVVARAALLPRLTASGSVTEQNADRLSPLGSSPRPPLPSLYTEEAVVAIRGRWVLFDGLRGWNAHAAAERALDAGEAAVGLASADATLFTVQAFYRLLAAQELARVADEAAGRQLGFERLVTALAETGRGSRLDLARARAQRLDAERARVAAREAETLAMAQLRRTMGLDGGEVLHAAGPLREPAPPPEDDGLAVARALHRSADLRRLDLQVAAARASARASRGTWFPEISVQGSYGWRGRDVGGRAPEWLAGAYAEWALFESGAGNATAARASARARELEANRRAAALQLEADLRDALGAWRTAYAAAAATRESAAASREALEAATALYGMGRVTSLDVLTANVELARAESARALALADAAVARARVERLAGAASDPE